MPPPAPPAVGDRLAQFRLRRELGRGGSGVVYEADDTHLHRSVAVKLVPERAEAGTADRVRREAQAAAKLDHPHVVRVYQVGRYPDGHYFVLELMTGSLEDRLADGRRIRWAEATRLLADACRGVVAAHAAGLVHRDLKPGNLMLDPGGRVKVADFGLVRGDDMTATTAGKVLGTPRYMSPEQCRGEPADVRSDVYALGVTYFALLTGRPPFADPTAVQVMYAHCHRPMPDPRAVQPDVPAACAAVVRRATAKDPSDRFQTVAELLAALPTADDPDETRDQAGTTLNGQAAPAGRVLSRRAWVILAGGGAALAATGGAVGWATGLWGGGATPTTPAGPDAAPARTAIPTGGSVSSLAFGPKNDLLGVGVSDGAGGVVVWDLGRNAVRRRLEWGPVNALAFYRLVGRKWDEHREPSHLIGGGTVGGPQGWLAEPDTGGPFVSGPGVGNWDDVSVSAAANKEGQATAFGYGQGGSILRLVLQYSPQTDGSLPDCVGPEGVGVRRLAYAPDADDNRLAVVYLDGRLWVFDFKSGQRRDETKLNAVEPNVTTVGFASGLGVLTVACGGRLTFLTRGDYAPDRKPLAPAEAAITALAHATDGRRLATGHTDGTVCVVELGREAVVRRRWAGHAGPVRAVAFSADGRRLATGGADGANLWDVADLV